MTSEALGLTAWQSLRTMRSSRPRIASRGARAKTFSAGLEQAEQLWRASAIVGPVVSPLLMFYSVTQAGRAICAAGIVGAAWHGKEMHGLRFHCDRPSNNTTLAFETVQVETSGSGLVQQVARLLASPVLGCQENLAALLCSLPTELHSNFAKLLQHRPLRVEGDVYSPPFGAFADARLIVSPVPKTLLRYENVQDGGRVGVVTRRYNTPSVEDVAAWLAQYPTLSHLGRPDDVGTPEPNLMDLNEMRLRVRWAVTVDKSTTQNDWIKQHIDVLAPEASWDYLVGLALPRVGSNEIAQHPLITWWLVLYAVSMLARYYPREWTALLDVDESTLAVPICELLETAHVEVPGLVREVLQRLC